VVHAAHADLVRDKQRKHVHLLKSS
jgi:hypothetical protein